jgi:hypothetical protein
MKYAINSTPSSVYVYPIKTRTSKHKSTSVIFFVYVQNKPSGKYCGIKDKQHQICASRGNLHVLTSSDVELNLGPFGQGNNTSTRNPSIILLPSRLAEQCLSILNGGGAGKHENCMKRR